MRSRSIALLSLLTAALVAGFVLSHGGADTSAAPARTHVAGSSAAADLARLPLRFERNAGQTDKRVRFLTRGVGYTLFLTDSDAVFSLADKSGRAAVVRMRVAGRGSAPVAGKRLPGVTNYLRGAGGRSATNVAGYASVTYRNAYRGIDVQYHGRRNGLEYDFLVAPGADPRRIALAFDGARSLKIDARKALRIATAAGELRQQRPVAYQMIDGRRQPVAVDYKLRSGHRVGLELGDYDRSRRLVIDPVVSYGTLLGGALADSVAGIAVSGGNAYVTGSTSSTDFPLAGAVQGTAGGAGDAFVAKLSSTGASLVYATYLGGGGLDRGRGIAVEGGEAYITGDTASADFPTADAITATAPASTNGFVTKLNGAGSALVYSTYLGGAGADIANAIAVASGAAHVVGRTASADFPTANAVQAAIGGNSDAFVTKINAAGSALVYSTYLGGTLAEDGFGIDVDGGSAYVAGQTASVNFPTTGGVAQPALAGGTQTDGFVTKLAAAGTSLAYSTYLGGAGVGGAGPAPTGADSANAIAVSGGQAYVTGQSNSGSFPTTVGALQPALAGEADAFVTKLSANATTLLYSTYLGGGSSDGANAIDVDGTNAYVAGSTGSGDFPLVDPASRRAGNGDAFLSKLSSTGASLLHSSIFGGNANDSAATVAADSDGNAYLAGSSSRFANGELPTAGGLQANHAGAGGVSDGFVFKVASGGTTDPLVTRLLPRSADTGGGATISIRGSGLAGATGVQFGATPATSFTVVSSTRIDAVVPAGTTGIVHVRVTAPGGLTPANPAARFAYAEGDFEVAGNMQQSRFAGTFTLLRNGKVLAAGGRSSQGGAALASAEIYDPLTRTWTPTGSMSETRFTHTATLLPNGKVLVAGGFGTGFTTNDQPNLRTAELYDPATGTWTSTPPMAVRHALHAAILLRGGACESASPPAYCGKVLIASGRTCEPQNTPPATGCNSTFVTKVAELYDPDGGPTGSWTTVAPLTDARTTTDAALLPDGRVLIPAGFPGGQTTSEIYNPATNMWTNAGLLAAGRARGGALRLKDGRILVASGFPNNQTGEVFDPATDDWTTTGLMVGFGRFDQLQAVLPNGKVIVAGGGTGGDSVELYDPATNAWSFGGLLAAGRGSSSSNANSQPSVVLSASPTSIALDPAVCGYDCGKVLLAGETDDRLTELYAQPGLPKPPPPPPPPPGPPPAPGATPPPPPPPAAAIVRRKGRLSAKVTPARDTRAPYRFRTTGTLTLPSGISKSLGCSGRVSVQVKRGKATISTRRVTLTRRCTFSSRVSFANRRRFGKATRLKFTARFLGNARVLPVTATPRYGAIRR